MLSILELSIVVACSSKMVKVIVHTGSLKLILNNLKNNTWGDQRTTCGHYYDKGLDNNGNPLICMELSICRFQQMHLERSVSGFLRVIDGVLSLEYGKVWETFFDKTEDDYEFFPSIPPTTET